MKVKFFNGEKGFGFLVRDDGQTDCFFHVSKLEGSHWIPEPGDCVEFELGTDRRGRNQAEKVRRL